jgi:hypothetical protein
LQRWPIGEEIRYQDGEVHPFVAALPYYGIVPKDPLAHLDFRIEIAERCAADEAYRQMILEWCAADFLFFVNVFCWIVEPRDESGDSLMPFNTWANQDPVMAAMAHYLGKRRDIVGDKSRAQGATWIVCALYIWGALFRRRKSFGIMSKDETTGDDYQDPNSVGWKIDFILKNLPEWMRPAGIEVNGPNRSTTHHTWRFANTDSTIKIYAANKTSARGGRATSFFLDEAGSFGGNRDLEALSNLQQVCFNRIVISTPNGTEIEFYRLVSTPSIWLKVILDWEDNPSQNEGKYTSKDGKLEVLDLDFEFPPDYDYILDGITRSPWFDNECARANHNMVEINRELRRDHGGSKTRPFPEAALSTALRFCRDPDHQGTLRFERSDPSDIDSMKWREEKNGPLKLWFHPDTEGLPPPGTYVVNADVAAGTGSSTSSNSCIQVFNQIGEQVAEFACNKTPPTKLARILVALCYWFGRGQATSYANFEKTGPLGTQFSGALKRLQYPHVYHMIDRTKRGAKRSNNPGWHTSKTANTLEPLVNALCDEQIVIRSLDLARECSEYEFDKGDWVHPGAKSAKDAADQGFNHGDRAVAAGIAVISLIDRHMLPDPRPKRKQEERLSDAPGNSIAGRYRDRQKRQREVAESRSCVW